MIVLDNFRSQGAADLSNNPLASPGPTVSFRPLPPLLLALYECLLCLNRPRRREEGWQVYVLLVPYSLHALHSLRRLFANPLPFHTVRPAGRQQSALRVENEKLKSTGWWRDGVRGKGVEGGGRVKAGSPPYFMRI